MIMIMNIPQHSYHELCLSTNLLTTDVSVNCIVLFVLFYRISFCRLSEEEEDYFTNVYNHYFVL